MVNNQDFYNAIKRDIEIVRGDTMAFNFQLAGIGGVEPTKVTFMIKENHEDADEDALAVCELGNGITLQSYDTPTDTLTYSVRLSPAKTDGLDLARYYYDLQIVAGGDVLTLMKGRFTLDYEVTKGVN